MAAVKPISTLSSKVYQKRRRFCSTKVEWKVVPSERKLLCESRRGVKCLKKPKVFALEFHSNRNLMEDRTAIAVKESEQMFSPVEEQTTLVPPYPPPAMQYPPGIPPPSVPGALAATAPSVHGTPETTPPSVPGRLTATAHMRLPSSRPPVGQVWTQGMLEPHPSPAGLACCICTCHHCPPPFHQGYPHLERTHLSIPPPPLYHQQQPMQPAHNLLQRESPVSNVPTEHNLSEAREQNCTKTDPLNKLCDTKTFMGNGHVIPEGTILQIIQYNPNGQLVNAVPSVGLLYHHLQPPPPPPDSPPFAPKLPGTKKSESQVEGVEPTNE